MNKVSNEAMDSDQGDKQDNNRRDYQSDDDNQE